VSTVEIRKGRSRVARRPQASATITPGIQIPRPQSQDLGEGGHGIAVTIQRSSEDDLLIDHGSLYPALQRLERQGLLKSKWGTSELNRRARFYELTRAGRMRLAAETGKWERMVRAIGRILQHPKEEES